MPRNILFILFVVCFSCKENFMSENTYLDVSGDIIREKYYPNGKLRAKSTYSKDTLLNGKHIAFFENGNRKIECFYQDGKIEGIFKQYYEDTGKLEGETPYINGKKQGTARFYYENSNLYSIINYHKNNRAGNAVWYQEQDTIPKEYIYYDSLGFKKYGCKYDSTGSVNEEKGSFMLNYSIDKGEIDPNEAITVNVCTVSPPSIKIDAALCNLNSDGDSIVRGSGTYPSVQEDHCYTFEKVYKEEGFYKFVLVLKITNELTGEVYPKVLREYDWAVNVWDGKVN